MKREIEFRAWDKKKKMWTNFQIYLLDGSIRYFDKHIGTWFSDNNNERFILEQYTGLKDKNGKEIYEGDIVKTHDKDLLEVFMEKGHCRIRYKKYDVIYEDYFHQDEVFIDNIKRVGNIHENPELLEVDYDNK